VVEDEPDMARAAEADGLTVVRGNATAAETLTHAGISRARLLFLAIPEGFEAGVVAERARKLQPDIRIIARAHSDEEVEHLKRLGANQVIMGEREIARVMLGSLI
jgi:CPA2 family monovalent cation:H+ antiporter-2